MIRVLNGLFRSRFGVSDTEKERKFNILKTMTKHSFVCALKNMRALQRVQKCAPRGILKGKYSNYEDGLEMLKIDNLDIRRK